MASERWLEWEHGGRSAFLAQLGLNEDGYRAILDEVGHEDVIQFAVAGGGLTYEQARKQIIEGSALVADTDARWWEIFRSLRESQFGRDRELIEQMRDE